MDQQSGQQHSISDDQELAKVLAGVTTEVDQVVPEEITTTPPISPMPVINDASVMPNPITPLPTPSEPITDTGSSTDGSLDSIKLDALNELRPLVDKLNVSAEEKFDTYLLLLRSTDDKELIAPAHEAAKGISDEARRAQALLDIIKEIDFLSQGQK